MYMSLTAAHVSEPYIHVPRNIKSKIKKRLATRQTCQTKWSSWINTDTPSIGDGDRETWKNTEKQTFCPGGNITKIECETVDDIPSYSSGDISTCSVSSGFVCYNADNFPIQCQDYKIRYFCSCSGIICHNFI